MEELAAYRCAGGRFFFGRRRKQTEILMAASNDNGSAADESTAVLMATAAEVARLKGKIQNLSLDLAAKTKAHETAAVELEVTQVQLETITKRAQNAATSHAGMSSALEVELEHANTLITELRKQLDAARALQAEAEADGAARRIAASEIAIKTEAIKLQVSHVIDERDALLVKLKAGAGASVQLDELEAAHAKIQALQEAQLAFADTEAELAGLKGRYSASETLQSKLRADVVVLQEELTLLRERFVKATQSTKDGLKGKLQAIQDKNRATQELATLKVKIERAALESAAEGAEVAVPVADEASLAEIDRLTKETASLQSQLDAAIEMQAEADSAAAAAAAAAAAVAATPAKPVVDEAMVAEVTSLNRENTSLRSQLDAAIEMQAEADSAAAAAAAAAAAVAATPAKPVVDEAMVAEVTSLNRENTSLRSQLDAAIEMQAEIKSEAKAAAAGPDAESAAQITRMTLEIEDLNLQVNTATDMYAAASAANANAPSGPDDATLAEIESLRAENATLQASVSGSKKQVKTLTADLDAATEMVVELQTSPSRAAAPAPAPVAAAPAPAPVAAAPAPAPEPEPASQPASKPAVVAVSPPKPAAAAAVAAPAITVNEPVNEPAFKVQLRHANTTPAAAPSGTDAPTNELASYMRGKGSLRKARDRPASMFEKPAPRATSEPGSKDDSPATGIAGRSKSFGKRGGSFTAPKTPKCLICNKAVYAMEKLEADGKIYHKKCFRCQDCNNQISLGGYAALNNKLYCKPCFKKLFKLKGNYSEGFGEEQHKMKWVHKQEEDAEC